MSHGSHSAAENCDRSGKRTDWLLWVCGTLAAAAYLLHLAFAPALAGSGWLAASCASVFELINTIWWGVLIGILTISVLGRVPRELVMGLLGTRTGLRGIGRAAVAGVLLDLCSHGILMVGAKLYERGASAGQVMAFLVASPWNSLSLTLVLVALIGLPWTLVFIAASLVIALVTGLLFDALVQRAVLPANPNRRDLPEDFDLRGAAARSWRALDITPAWLAATLLDGLRESRMVVRWILFGVLLASLLRAFVPADLFSTWFGPSALGLLATLAAAAVIEVCSEGSTPLAADLLTRAGAPGNSFAFLMGGVATDYTELLVLREATGSWRLALFLPLVTLPQTVALAVLMNGWS